MANFDQFSQIVREYNPEMLEILLHDRWQGIIYSILEKKDEASKQFEKYRQLAKDFPDQNLLDNLMSAKMAESFKHNGQEKDEAENLPKEDELSKPLDASGAGGDTLYVEDKSDN